MLCPPPGRVIAYRVMGAATLQPWVAVIVFFILAGVAAVAAPPRGGPDPTKLPEPLTRPVKYFGDVHPILATHCISCHGAEDQKAGLRLIMNKPYERFLIEQIAADQLELQPDDPALAALGFLTVGPRFRGRTEEIINDRIDVITRGLMGMTVACARCHDHKYDPIPTADFYSLYGVLASSEDAECWTTHWSSGAAKWDAPPRRSCRCPPRSAATTTPTALPCGWPGGASNDRIAPLAAVIRCCVRPRRGSRGKKKITRWCDFAEFAPLSGAF